MTVIDVRDRRLAHHFDTPAQQFEAAKLGMWLFLATEVLLFGGLFCLYAVMRATHYEIFEYGHQFLDTRWGIINTTVLITSSLTMAIGVTAAQQGRYRLLVSMLVLTFLGGAIFMTVKYIEYHHKFSERLVWGMSFYDPPEWAIHVEPEAAAEEAAPAAYEPDPGHGRVLWNATCRSCHGDAGQGVEGQGKDIRGVEFVTSRNDADLLAFIQAGRTRTDPLNTTGVDMPPRGGNPLLSDTDLLDVIAVVRTFEPGPGGVGTVDAAQTDSVETEEEEFWIPRSSIPLGPDGPPGIDPDYLEPAPDSLAEEAHDLPHHALDPDRPHNAHLFFVVYFCMTGLHGVHVVAGMAVIAWLAFRAIRRDFGPGYFTPVDLGGLYWHIVDIIWIFLFPLLYLVG